MTGRHPALCVCVIVSLVALGLAAGCEARLSLGGSCTRTSDCAEPLVCALGGRCREACVTSRDCSIGLRCIRDPAAADPTSAVRICSLDDDGCRATPCAPGLVCFEALCVNDCRVASECPDGVCRSGLCEPPTVPGLDAPAVPDVGPEAGLERDGGPDARPLDAGMDGAVDASGARDGGSDAAGEPDVGLDAAGPPDGGLDAGPGAPDGGAATATPEATLRFGTAASGDLIGYAVAMSADGSRAVVGAPSQANGAGMRTGAAAVLFRSGSAWSVEALLTASDGADVDEFGHSVALSPDGSLAVVGAPGDDVGPRSNQGSAHFFVRTGSTWTEEPTLLASDGTTDDFFGWSVALSADSSRVLVGAAWDNTAGALNAGSARVFLRSGATWLEEATLLASDRADEDLLGCAVALSADGSRALVGAYPDDTTGGLDAGSARVFTRTGTTWTEEATLVAADGAAGDYLGYSVALSADGSRALVGAIADDVGIANVGSARLFTRSGTVWTEDGGLFATDGASSDSFGRSVALSADGRLALVGAPGDDTAAGLDVGSVRTFVWSGSGWAEGSVLEAPDGAPFDGLAVSVALAADATRAIVGASADDDAIGIESGSARIFFFGP